jgi:hypothetical protein
MSWFPVTISHSICLNAYASLGQCTDGGQFPFERFNGIIQRFNTNSKVGEQSRCISRRGCHLRLIGELETTFMQTFCRAANLRTLISDCGGWPIVEVVWETFEKYFGAQFKPSLKQDLRMGNSFGEHNAPRFNPRKRLRSLGEPYYGMLSQAIRQTCPGALHSPSVQPKKRSTVWGVSYSGAATSEGDSKSSSGIRALTGRGGRQPARSIPSSYIPTMTQGFLRRWLLSTSWCASILSSKERRRQGTPGGASLMWKHGSAQTNAKKR